MSSERKSFSLKLFGGCVLEGADGLVAGRVAQRRRLAVLALIAAGGPNGASRERIAAILWPDTAPDAARRLVADTLYVLRSALGDAALVAVGDLIALAPDVVTCDVAAFDDALKRGDAETAAARYAGPFLDGFHLPDAPEFTRWADAERDRLAAAYAKAAERLADAAAACGDHAGAAERWRQIAAARPYDGRVARRLVEAMDAAGDRAGAIAHVQHHAALLRADLDVEADGALLALAERLRVAPQAERPAAGLTPAVAHPVASPAPAPTAPAPTVEPASAAPVAVPPAAGLGTPPRRLRRRVALVGSLAAVATAAGAWALSWRGPEFANRRVVVAPFVNETGDTTLAPLGRMAADWVTQGLGTTGLADVVPSTAALAAARYVDSVSRGTGRDRSQLIAAETDAGLVVSGSVYRVGDSVQLRAEIVDPRRGRVVRSFDPISAPANAPMPAVELLRQRTSGALALLLDEQFTEAAATMSAPPSYEAYREFTEGRRLAMGGDRAKALGRFERAYALDSTYTLALVMTAIQHANFERWDAVDSIVRRVDSVRGRLAPYDAAMLELARAWSRRDWAAAHAVARRAALLAPSFRMQVAIEAFRTNRPAEATRVLEALDPERGEMRGRLGYWPLLMDVYHTLGRYDDELRTARHFRELNPAVLTGIDYELRALAALGRPAEALALSEERYRMPSAPGRGVMQTMFTLGNELRAHGHADASRAAFERLFAWLDSREPAAREAYECLGCRADALLAVGRPNEAMPIIKRLIATDSTDYANWRMLGAAAAMTGDRVTALGVSARLDTLREPNEGPLTYHHGRVNAMLDRARIAALLGDKARATTLLQDGLANGMPFNALRYHRDGGLDPLRDHPSFIALMKPKG